MDLKHAAEFRRCLVEVDVKGIMKLWRHVAPHLANQTPEEALTALHMARCEAKSIHNKLKLYSVAWLAERGYQKVDGNWIHGPKMPAVASAVGIASRSQDPAFAKKITTAMQDALLNGLAKGIIEPPRQKELMLKARDRVRFKAARI